MSEVPSSPNPYESPSAPGHAPTGPTDYEQVPLLRRNGFCSGMIVAHLIVSLLSGGVPLVAILGVFTMVGVIVVCVVVLTGPVYYNKHDSNGILKQWSAANKVAAVILLVLFTAGFGFVAYQILTAK